MARLPRLCPAGIPLHVIQRGNNRQVCFVCVEDYKTYLSYLHDGARKYGVDIHAWVLMTNHVHLLSTPQFDGSVSKMMQYLGRHYVRYYNQMYQRTGMLWEGRFKSCVVDTDVYFLACQRYIELNPVRAGMVSDPMEYRWPSYPHNAFGTKSQILSQHDVYIDLGADALSRQLAYRGLFKDELEESVISDLREATTKCLAFGGDRFKEEIELLCKRRVRPEKTRPNRHHSSKSFYSDPKLQIGVMVQRQSASLREY